MAEKQPEWTDIAGEAEITPERPLVFKRGRQQLVVMRDGDGCLRALDNRCPHEGYPLAQGQVRDCTLTCAWHNFKFDLRDGACLKGDEALTVYPVRVQSGRVEVDLHVAPQEGAMEQGLARLHEGLRERRLGQVARQIVRLLDLGMEPRALAMEAACFDAERAEWGSTHALALASEVIELLPHYPGAEAALPLMQVFDMASEPNVRRDPLPIAEAIDPGDDPEAAALRMRQLVEDEQGEQAEGLLRGALARGWGRAEIEPMLYGPTCDHFLSFGHPLIYQGTVFNLLDLVGWEHAPRLLPGHLRGIVGGTREDTLPRWRKFTERLAAIESKLAGWRNEREDDGRAADLPQAEREALWQGLVDGGRDEAFDAVQRHLDAGSAPTAVADVIGAAAALRMLRFETAYHQSTLVQEGWLDVTHTLTFAAAVRQTVQRYRHPSALRTLFYAARFVHNARALDVDDPIDSVAPSDEPATAEALCNAIAERDVERALALAARYLDDHGCDHELRRAIAHLPLTDLYTRPIVVAHAIKTGRAAFALFDRLEGTRWQHAPVLAFVRFAASLRRERPVSQLVHEAQRLVVDGKVPRALT